MKKKLSIIALALAFVSVISVSIGIYQYNKNKEIIKGCFFRKMYGSVGIVEGNEYLINMNMFCFDSNIDFLKKTDFLSFDNPDVFIKSLDITEQDKNGELIIYNLVFRLSVNKDGQSNITALNYNDGTNISVYKIGDIALIKNNVNSIYLQYGIDSLFINNNTNIIFSKENEEPFTVSDLIYAKNDMYICSYDKDMSFTPGKDLIYNINVDTSYDDRDIFLFQPIFVIKHENESKNYYFTPNMPICNAKELTFLDIREYVK